MSFYTETWAKMTKFNGIIDKLPGTLIKLNSILLETNTLKKILTEIPRQITDSIRTNVVGTMETAAKLLREDLSSISEQLD